MKFKNLLITLFITLINISIVYYLINTHSQSKNELEKVRNVIQLSHNLMIDLKSTESGQRGYLLTLNENYLTFYYKGIENTDTIFYKLFLLTEEQEQKTKLNSIKKLIDYKFEELKQTIELAQQNKKSEALKIINLNHGKEYMDQIRALVSSFIARENTKWNENHNKYQTSLTYLYILIMIEIIVGAFSLYFIFQQKNKLQRTQEELNLSVKSADIGIWKYDVTNNILDWNYKMFEIYGKDSKSNKASYDLWRETLSEDCREDAVADFKSALASKEKFDTTFKIKVDGKIRYIKATGLVNFDKHYNALSVIGTNIDITDLVQSKLDLEIQKEKFKALIDNASDYVHILDEKGNVTECSYSFALSLGYTKEEALKLNVKDWDADVSIKENHLMEQLMNEARIFRTLHKKKNGRLFHVQVNTRAIEIDGTKYLYASSRDITNLIIYEEALKDEKEKALEEKEKALLAYEEARVSEEEAISTQEEMLVVQEELIQANEAKSEFLANMSHEIRTPISGIIGVTDIMIEEDCSDSQREYLNIIKTSSESLKNIINDILDFSKIQAGKFQIVNKQCDIYELLENIKNLFTPQVNSKNLDFEIIIDKEVQRYVIADSLRISQVITNLVGNSVKFTQKGKIIIRVQTLIKFGDNIKLKFTIEDSGIGIPQKLQNQIFESFVQGELSNTKNYKGTGLGLSISKSLIELMNGTLDFESYEGVGSKFFFILEMKFIDEKNIQPIEKEDISQIQIPSGLKALVAEDSEVNQLVIKKILDNLDFEVSIANDGEEAVDLARKYKYDIIFMDIQMPNMDGYEATRIIRTYDKQTPILALSAAVLPEDVKKSLDIGMNKHIKKPIDKNELFTSIKEILNLSKIPHIKINKQNHINKPKKKTSSKDEFQKAVDILREDFEEDGVKTLFNLYLEQYKDYKEIIENINDENLKKYIHKLKGSSGNLGFKNIYNLCLDIEKMNKEEAKILLEDLKKKMDKLLENINGYFK